MAPASLLLPARGPTAPARVHRVLLVDDHRAVLEMMRSAVESMAGFAVVGSATDAMTALEACRKLRPDVVILDLALAKDSGLTLLPHLKEAWPAARIVVFSGHLRMAAIKRAMLAGASGLVEKTASLDEFHEALAAAAAGKIYFSRFASEEIRRLVERPAHSPGRIVRLSAREKSVLQGIAEGLSSKEISTRLGLSAHTVVNHRSRLMKKTRLRGPAQLARFAVTLGLVSEEVEGAPDAL